MGFGNIVCKTVGITALSAVLYDSAKIGKAISINSTNAKQADTFESIEASRRTTTNVSPVTNMVQNRVAKLRMDNPIRPAIYRVKGYVKGFLTGLGMNIIPVSLAAMAIAGKGAFAKIGAWGCAIYGALTVLKEIFGIGKSSPVD